MLRPRRQGAKQPDRTENPDTRPHTHSHCLIGRTCPSLEFLFDEPRCVQASKEEDLLTGVSVCFPTFRILLGPLRLCVGTLAIASQRGPAAATKDLNTEFTETSPRPRRRKPRKNGTPALRLLRGLGGPSANSVLALVLGGSWNPKLTFFAAHKEFAR